MNRDTAIYILDALHTAQNDFYAGGSEAALEQLLTPDITWHVPGDNLIAGDYRGRAEVFGYFRKRRDLAERSFRIERTDVLVGGGYRVAALNDGVATIRDIKQHWSTVGLYDIVQGHIGACRLLPLDQDAFDAIWSA